MASVSVNWSVHVYVPQEYIAGLCIENSHSVYICKCMI